MSCDVKYIGMDVHKEAVVTRALRRVRHFALVETVLCQTRLARNQYSGQELSPTQNEVVYSIILTDAKNPLSLEEVDAHFEGELLKK